MEWPSAAACTTPKSVASARGTGIAETVTPAPQGQVLVDHLHWVHAVDVIGSADHDEVRPVFIEQAQRLVDRVCRAGLPAWSQPLLRRHRGHVIAERAAQPPGGRQMPVQAVALVLGEHADPADPAVDQVGQREIHQPVQAAERNGRLGPLRGQRREPPPRRARQDDAKNPLASHPRTPCRARSRLMNDARRTAVRPSSASAASYWGPNAPTHTGERERSSMRVPSSGKLNLSGSGRVGFGVAAALTPSSPASSSGTAGRIVVRAGSMVASFTLRCVFFDSRSLDYRHPVGHIHAHCAAPSAGSRRRRWAPTASALER